MSRPWSRCACNRCEYNDVLLSQDRVCQGCKRQVKLYKPRSSSSNADAINHDSGDQPNSGKGKDKDNYATDEPHILI
eukprot:4908473-Pyramimonas_sp.AAC.1